MRKKSVALILALIAAVTFTAFGCSGRGKPPAHEHSYNDTETVAPTCVSEGYTLRKCDCGDSYKDSVVPALGHDFTLIDHTDESHYTRCSRCKITEQNGADEHIMRPEGEGVKCSECGYEVAESEGLEFYLTDDGEGYGVTSTEYSSTVLVIPETHEGKPVTEIAANAFSDSKAWIRNIVLPSSLKTVNERAMSNFRANRVFFRGTVAQWCGIDFARDQDNPVYLSLSGELWIGGELLTELEVPQSVKTVKPYAFIGCESLEKVSFAEGVTKLDSSSFAYSGVKRLSIPASLTDIAGNAFDGCPLESIESAGGKYAIVNGCWIDTETKTLLRGFKGASVPADGSVTSIAAKAFQNSGITEVAIPDCVTEMGDGAFSGCEKLTKVTMGNGIKVIPQRAFEGCISLRKFTVPDSVTTISKYAFSGCSRLVSVVVGRGVTAIEGKKEFFSSTYAFYNCDQLFEIYNLSSLTITAGNGTANGAIGAKAIDVYGSVSEPSKLVTDESGVIFYAGEQKVYCMGYEGSAAEVTLPQKYDGKSYEIAASAFRNDDTIEKLVIPDGVKAIGISAFWGMKKLKSASIGEGPDTVGWNCFYECENLETVKLPSSLKSLGRYAFKNCYALRSIEVPDGVTSLDDSVFSKCISLQAIKLPASLSSFGGTFAEPFSGCSSLKSVVIPDGVTSLPQNSFINCTSLESVTIGSGLKSIGPRAFRYCSSLKSIDLKNVETIDDYAFANCESLKSVNLPKVKTVGSYAFYQCAALETVKLDAVETIGTQAFIYCSSLASLDLGNAVTTIKTFAFYGARLAYVVLPASLSTLEDYAFYSEGDTVCANIYCEAQSVPDTWSSDWNYVSETVVGETEEGEPITEPVYATVYLAGEWSYGSNGVPHANK